MQNSKTLEIEEIFPSPEEEKYTLTSCDKFFNRLILCTLAICFLWLTSLQVCVEIVNSSITVPPFTNVIELCQFTFDNIDQQKKDYLACADHQMSTCDQQLDESFDSELTRVSSLKQSNKIFLEFFEQLVTNCSSLTSSAKESISAFSKSGVHNHIHYFPNCSTTERKQISQSLGDVSTSQTTVLASSRSYTSSVDRVIHDLTEFAGVFAEYNVQYVQNKTSSLHELTQTLAFDVSTPYVEQLSGSFKLVFDVLDRLEACTSFSNRTELVQSCGATPSAQVLYEQARVELNGRLSAFETTLNIVGGLVDQYSEAVKVALGNADRFYDSVNGAKGLVQWVDNNLLFDQSSSFLCGKSSPNWCDFSKEDWFVNNLLFPDFPPIPKMQDSYSIWRQVEHINTKAFADLQLASTDLSTGLDAWKTDLQHTLGPVAGPFFSPEDYDPPSYPLASSFSTVGSVEEEARDQVQRTMSFLVELENIITDSNTSSQSILEDTVTRSSNTTLKSLTSSALSQFNAVWAAVELNIEILPLFNSLVSVQSILFLFDFLYRLLQSIRVLRRFWGRSAVALPAVDVRSRKVSDSDVEGTVWFQYVNYFLDVLPFIWLQLLLVGLLVVGVTYAVAAVFIPSYQGYVSACVHHTTNDTFFSRNLQALSVNYASSDGHGRLARGVGEYNVRLQEQCVGNAAESAQEQSVLLDRLYALNYSLSLDLSERIQLEGCVDIQQMDKNYLEACCTNPVYENTIDFPCSRNSPTNSPYECPMVDTLLNIPYLPPGNYLETYLEGSELSCASSALLEEWGLTTGSGTESGADVIFRSSLGSVVDEVFNCDALPLCQIQCSGPDLELLASSTKSCSCTAEWYFNGYFLRISVALCVFILLNASRVLIVSGIIRLTWKSLTSELFEFTAVCSEDGTWHLNESPTQEKFNIKKPVKSHDDKKPKLKEIVSPSSIQIPLQDVENQKQYEAESKLKHVVQKEIRKQLHLYWMKGFFMLVFGLFLNIPWIVLLHFTKRDIVYDPYH